MKKIIVSIILLASLVSVALYSCKKTDSNNNLSKNDALFVQQSKDWFNNTFVNTTVYKNATKDGAIKTPIWKYGKVYTMGNATVAEFPLSSNEKNVIVSSAENLNEAQRLRVAENTKVNIIIIKAPNKPMEVRMVQFIPTFSYLEDKKFDLSDMDLKNYRKDFKGSLMMFEYDNKFITGYSFSKNGNKTIKFRDKNLVNRKRNETNNQTAPQYLCNGQPFDPACNYNIIWGFWFRCSGGWTVEEGYNPSYCIKESEWIESCEKLECSGTGGGNATQECLSNGSTQEQCDCMLYGIGCEGGGGEEECDPSLTSPQEQEFNDYKQMESTEKTLTPPISNPTLPTDPITGTSTWVVVKGLVAGWRVEAVTEFKYHHDRFYTVYGTVEENYNLFHLKTITTNFIGYNTFITSTWTHTNANAALLDQVFNNNTGSCRGVSNVIGTLRHVANYSWPIPLPYCPKLLDATFAVDNTHTLYPR
jgi:hypothetical protein